MTTDRMGLSFWADDGRFWVLLCPGDHGTTDGRRRRPDWVPPSSSPLRPTNNPFFPPTMVSSSVSFLSLHGGGGGGEWKTWANWKPIFLEVYIRGQFLSSADRLKEGKLLLRGIWRRILICRAWLKGKLAFRGEGNLVLFFLREEWEKKVHLHAE